MYKVIWPAAWPFGLRHDPCKYPRSYLRLFHSDDNIMPLHLTGSWEDEGRAYSTNAYAHCVWLLIPPHKLANSTLPPTLYPGVPQPCLCRLVYNYAYSPPTIWPPADWILGRWNWPTGLPTTGKYRIIGCSIRLRVVSPGHLDHAEEVKCQGGLWKYKPMVFSVDNIHWPYDANLNWTYWDDKVYPFAYASLNREKNMCEMRRPYYSSDNDFREFEDYSYDSIHDGTLHEYGVGVMPFIRTTYNNGWRKVFVETCMNIEYSLDSNKTFVTGVNNYGRDRTQTHLSFFQFANQLPLFRSHN